MANVVWILGAWFSSGRRSIFGATLTVWLAVCAAVLWHLMRRAAEAPPATIEEYARAPSFQVLDFAVGYLPSLVLLSGARHTGQHRRLRRSLDTALLRFCALCFAVS